MYKNILVPTDGSKLSKKAVVGAVRLAKATGARLVALHVYPKFSGSPYGSFGPPDEVIADAHAMHHQSEAKKIFAGIRMLAGTYGIGLDTVLVESDNVHKEIIAAARKRKCDLVCMASHGRRGLSGLVLGSETQKVLTHSSTPVLVLR
jgi:nucleotide-binding universal stress UspA family protein